MILMTTICIQQQQQQQPQQQQQYAYDNDNSHNNDINKDAQHCNNQQFTIITTALGWKFCIGQLQ